MTGAGTNAAMKAPLRVAGLGAGYFSRFHYDAWRRLDRVELIAVADRALPKAEEVCARTWWTSSPRRKPIST